MMYNSYFDQVAITLNGRSIMCKRFKEVWKILEKTFYLFYGG